MSNLVTLNVLLRMASQLSSIVLPLLPSFSQVRLLLPEASVSKLCWKQADPVSSTSSIGWAGGNNVLFGCSEGWHFSSFLFYLKMKWDTTIWESWRQGSDEMQHYIPSSQGRPCCPEIVSLCDKLLCTLLEQTTTTTLHLADIFHEKTNGNPLFVVQYM